MTTTHAWPASLLPSRPRLEEASLIRTPRDPCVRETLSNRWWSLVPAVAVHGEPTDVRHSEDGAGRQDQQHRQDEQ
jgi:hypothetical protein